MKTFRLIAATFFCAAIFAVSAFAQAAAPTSKIGIVDTNAFASKTGITKYVSAMTSLETEMRPEETAYQTMKTKIQTLEKELQDIQNQLNNDKLPPAVDKTKLTATFQTKYQEGQDLSRQLKVKEEDIKIKYQRRGEALVSPIYRDISIALQEYAKKNGYAMIFDIAKDQTGMLLFLDEKQDVTKDFITFYNARPATTAAVK